MHETNKSALNQKFYFKMRFDVEINYILLTCLDLNMLFDLHIDYTPEITA